MENRGNRKYPRPTFVGFDAPSLASNVPPVLTKGSIVSASPRSIGFGTPNQLKMLLGKLDEYGGKALAIDAVMSNDGAVEFDREMARFRKRSGWLTFTNLRGRAHSDALETAFIMGCTVRHYGERVPGLSKFSEPGQCFRISVELKIQRGNESIEPYDVLTHLDVLTEEASTPVAEMLMASRNPGIVVDQKYKFQGVEKATYATLPKNKRQALPGEWVIGFGPTMLHSAPPEIDGTRMLARVFVAPISREEFEFRAPSVMNHLAVLEGGEPVQATEKVVWNHVDGVNVPSVSYEDHAPLDLSLPGDPEPFVIERMPWRELRAMQ